MITFLRPSPGVDPLHRAGATLQVAASSDSTDRVVSSGNETGQPSRGAEGCPLTGCGSSGRTGDGGTPGGKTVPLGAPARGGLRRGRNQSSTLLVTSRHGRRSATPAAVRRGGAGG